MREPSRDDYGQILLGREIPVKNARLAGHGSPDVPPIWYATIFTDGLTGIAVLAFTIWSALTVRAGRVGGRSARALEVVYRYGC